MRTITRYRAEISHTLVEYRGVQYFDVYSYPQDQTLNVRSHAFGFSADYTGCDTAEAVKRFVRENGGTVTKLRKQQTQGT
jgi:hypothetical protein